MNIELYLPFPPSINNYYVKTRNGVFISSKGRAHREAVIKSVSEQLGPTYVTSFGRIHMSVVWFMPDKRTRDLDNYLKPLLDSMVHAGVWDDDRQIDQLFVYRGELRTETSGIVFVRLSEAAPVIRFEQVHLID